ncbi:MAG: methyltransferase [Legionellales bacterium]|nr:methyltransferase [Legionellales bacterium]|tara:strand:- start:12393 stop:13241 length:849 start_codon:yes stop_codon:yes gene_type:complete
MDNPFEPINHVKDCRYGKMLYNIHDMYIGKALDLYGEYCQFEIDIFEHLVKPGDVALDLGANMGSHTVYYAQKVGPKGAVIAVEPQRIIYQILCANVALNSLLNVHCLHYAVGDAAGDIIIPPIDYSKDNNFGAIGLGSFTQGERVSVMLLDNLQVPRCDLIKIDVEGMETAVLRGATKMIQQHNPVLFVENDRQEHSRELLETLFGFGYQLYWACTPYFNPNNYFNNNENIYGRSMSVNMLCLPEGYGRQPNLPPITSSDVNIIELLSSGKLAPFDPNNIF